MSGFRGPELWTVLGCEDGAAIVVEHDTSTIDALLSLIEEETGERFEADNPFIVEESATATVERWNSCSETWCEAEGVEGTWGSYWAPDGDGKRWCYVVNFSRSAWVLNELASDAALEKEQG